VSEIFSARIDTVVYFLIILSDLSENLLFLLLESIVGESLLMLEFGKSLVETQ
jgi:hypothetical protein